MSKHYATIRQVAGDLLQTGRNWAITVSEYSYTISDDYILPALVERNYSKRFNYYEGDPDDALYSMWVRTLKTLDTQIKALAYAAVVEFNPMNDYTRSRSYSETAENTRETTYGKKDTRAGSGSNTTTYNSTVTNDIVTYDDTLRDHTKSTRGGTDSDSSSSSSSSTLSGKDTQQDDGGREITETVTGTSRSPADNLRAYLDTMLRDDVLDFVLAVFERRYLYYGGE